MYFISRSEVAVYPLWQPGIHLTPWCPNGEVEVERACNREDDVPDDPPEEGIQNEEHGTCIHDEEPEDMRCVVVMEGSWR